MRIDILALCVAAVHAIPFPNTRGPYQVGITQHVFNHTTPNDPVAPQNASSKLLVTIYYPTESIPTPQNITPYLDNTTAQLWGSALQFPNGSLESLTTLNIGNASYLGNSECEQNPTVILSPGGGVNAIMYDAISSNIASQGHTVLAIDHPGEAPYLQLPNGEGVYGIDITASWNRTLQTAVYEMRVSDALALTGSLFSGFVTATGAPWNDTHYFMMGHSIGGAAAAGAAATSRQIIGAINLDGGFFDLSDVQKPYLMIASEEHTPHTDPTWSPFSQKQTGWWLWTNVTGSDHLNFCDIGDWVDMLGLSNKTITPQLGSIVPLRMDTILRSYVEAFFDFVLGKPQTLMVGPSTEFPEMMFVNGSQYGHAY